MGFFLLSFDYYCSVALGWSTESDCGISWSYSLAFFIDNVFQ